MVIKLANGNIEYANNLKDIKELIDPSIAEAIEEIIENTYSDEESYKEDIQELEYEKKQLEKELQKAKNETVEAYSKMGNMSSLIWSLKKLSEDYHKSNSKRIDKDILLNKLDELIKEFK